MNLITPQVIKWARNETHLEEMQSIFCELFQHIIKRTIKKEMFWNMDETAFIQKQNPCKVVVSKSSRNMWSKSADVIFHMQFVVSVSVAIYLALPLFILPVKCLNMDVLEG